MRKKKTTQKTVGRKTKMTPYTLGKLREAFLLGCSDVEACFYAEIHPDTLYQYQTDNPKYSEQKKALKSNPILLARKTVVTALSNDPNLALKYLERRLNEEFALKQTITQTKEPDRITGISYIVPKGGAIPTDLFDSDGNSVSVTIASE